MTDLRERIRDRVASVAVIGCGYVGLPLSTAFAAAGFPVVGFDVDSERVASLSRGESHIMDVPSTTLRALIDGGKFRATTDFACLRSADVIFVAVPTPSDRAKQPDLRYIVSAAEQIAANLRREQLIVLESTTFPGTTEEVLRPILERTGLVAGTDFYLAFSPERIDPGSTTHRIANTPKVVGGVDPKSTELAVFALQQIITEGQIHAVSSSRAAELTKLLENTFRAVNIALVNELTILCHRMGIDIWEVIEAAATKPYGFMPFYPGPGVGGHCIPVDPYYLAWKAREYDFPTKFIELAAETNLAMPFYTVDRVRQMMNDAGRSLHGAKLLVLGASFKKDVDDARNSAAIRVMEILRSEGVLIEYHDPHVAEVRLAASLYAAARSELVLRSVSLDAARLAAADCVLILVPHTSVDYDVVLANARMTFDAVNATGARAGRGPVERL